MLRLWILEYLLCVTLNLFRCLPMNVETYEFILGKNEHGEPAITHKVASGTSQIHDTLTIDASITIEPTQVSYDFMKLLLAELRDYLAEGQRASPKKFAFVEFAELDLGDDLQNCLEEFIKFLVNDIDLINVEDLLATTLNMLFTIEGVTMIVGRGESADCSELVILNVDNYPIVKVSEKLATLWPDNSTDASTSARRECLAHERWVNFDNLDVLFPIFS